MRSAIAWIGATLVALLLGCHGGARVTAVSADVAYDRETGLEWTRHDHERSLAWDDADHYCRTLAIGDRRGWRLPELAELQQLYDPHVSEPCGDRTCHLDPAVQIGGPYVWTATARGEGTRFYFDASYGTSFSPGITPRLVRRVLCVRADR